MNLRKPAANGRGSTAISLWILLIFIAHLPFLGLHFAALWRLPLYQYYPLVIVAVCLLLWTRWDGRVRGISKIGQVGGFGSRSFALASVSLVLLASAVLVFSPWLAVASAIVFAATLVFDRRNRPSIVNLAGIWCLLWLLIPVPSRLEHSLMHSIQGSSSALGSRILDQLNCLHVIRGNVLALPGNDFALANVTGGIASPMAMVAISAIVAVWRNRPLLHSILLIASGAVSSAFLAMLRLVAVALAYDRLQLNLTEGLLSRFAAFVLVAVAVWSTDALLAYLLKPMGDWARRDHRTREENPLVDFWNRLAALGTPAISARASTPSPRRRAEPDSALRWEQTALSHPQRRSISPSAFASPPASTVVRNGSSAFASDPLASDSPAVTPTVVRTGPSAFAGDPLEQNEHSPLRSKNERQSLWSIAPHVPAPKWLRMYTVIYLVLGLAQMGVLAFNRKGASQILNGYQNSRPPSAERTDTSVSGERAPHL